MKPATVAFALAIALFSAAMPEAGGQDALGDLERSVVALVERVRPSVVQVIAEREFPFPHGDILPLGSSFAKDSPFTYRNSGSGFFIDEEGHILTTAHVVEGADRISAVLADGTAVEAQRKGMDPAVNIALLKISPPGAKALTLGDSDALRPGSPVIMVGNPFGLASSVSWGIVSGLRRRRLGISEIEDHIQISACINPGESGAPLFNSRGEVIGILTGSLGGNRAAEWWNPFRGTSGIAFAIPINMVKVELPELKKGKRIEHGWLGIGVQRLTAALRSKFGVPGREGVLVSMVIGGSPAERAGVKDGDVITSLDGQPVTTPSDLLALVSRKEAGQKVSLALFRNGKEQTVEITVGKRSSRPRKRSDEADGGALGLTLKNVGGRITGDSARSGGGGVMVTEVRRGSPADSAGLKRGDVITEVNREKIRNVAEWRKLTGDAKPGESVLLRSQRGFFVLEIE